MLQSKLGSFYEALINILIGYSISTAANWLVLPYWFEGVTLGNSMVIGLVFTVISLARSYIIRRWFNARLHKLALKMADGREEVTPYKR